MAKTILQIDEIQIARCPQEIGTEKSIIALYNDRNLKIVNEFKKRVITL